MLVLSLKSLIVFWLVLLSAGATWAQEKSEKETFPPSSYVFQMLELFRESALMEEVWIDYIRKRSGEYLRIAEKLKSYPMLANLDFVGNAQDYSYDFLAMQAVRCDNYRSAVLAGQKADMEDPELPMLTRAFDDCVTILSSKLREALIDLKRKTRVRQ